MGLKSKNSYGKISDDSNTAACKTPWKTKVYASNNLTYTITYYMRMWPKSLSWVTRTFFIRTMNTMSRLRCTARPSLQDIDHYSLSSQLRVPLQKWPSAERSCLTPHYAAFLGTACNHSGVWGLGLLPQSDTTLKDHPTHHRLTSPSAHLYFHHPTRMFLKVLPNTLPAHKSPSLRICFLGNLIYNIYYVYSLRSSYIMSISSFMNVINFMMITNYHN